MFLDADRAIEQIQQAYSDAAKRIGHLRFQVLSWPQTWGSTACGFGGIAGQAFCDAQTVIVSGDTDAVLVYHRGKFAYECDYPNDAFYIACGQRQLPGAADWPKVSQKFNRTPTGATP